ncbi:hypothetical protein TNCV_5122191 [Trichonephila clavipes]|nr:hypothetical protein TNCV_5122191 [Trichonephila clavipes]
MCDVPVLRNYCSQQRRDQKSLENRGRRLGRPRDFCDLPIRWDEGRVVNTPLVFKRSSFWRRRKGDEREKEKERKEKRGEREEPGLGWRKGKSPALDGEGMRGEPWLERTGRER